MFRNNRALSLLSMILGIASVVLMCVPHTGYAFIVVAIIGIILAIRARKIAPSGMATIGFICSIIALLLWAVMLIVILLL